MLCTRCQRVVWACACRCAECAQPLGGAPGPRCHRCANGGFVPRTQTPPSPQPSLYGPALPYLAAPIAPLPSTPPLDQPRTPSPWGDFPVTPPIYPPGAPPVAPLVVNLRNPTALMDAAILDAVDRAKVYRRAVFGQSLVQQRICPDATRYPPGDDLRNCHAVVIATDLTAAGTFATAPRRHQNDALATLADDVYGKTDVVFRLHGEQEFVGRLAEIVRAFMDPARPFARGAIGMPGHIMNVMPGAAPTAHPVLLDMQWPTDIFAGSWPQWYAKLRPYYPAAQVWPEWKHLRYFFTNY